MNTGELLQQALDWQQQGLKVVLARVVMTWGSSPRPVGSILIISEQLEFLGSVSGGCIEAAVIDEAKGLMQGGQPKLLQYGVSNEMAWEVGLACGGQVQVLLQPLPATATIQTLLQLHKTGQTCLLLSWLDGRSQLLARDDIVNLPAELTDQVHNLVRQDRSGLIDKIFIHLIQPPLQLIIVGAVHIAQALAPMAQLCDYQITLIDPRQAWG